MYVISKYVLYIYEYIYINVEVIFLGKDYIIEALNFHLLKSEQPGTIPKTIRTKPRQPVGLPKVSISSD